VQRSTGGLLTRSYAYAAGYHLGTIEGERAVNADALRYETVRRLDEHITVPGVPELTV
jgi:hypothetical protein